jgi:hypothetical protein
MADLPSDIATFAYHIHYTLFDRTLFQNLKGFHEKPQGKTDAHKGW